MPERRYREVQSHSQFALFPPSMDDYVSGDNPVRAIDAFIDTLDLESLGFGHTEAYGGAGGAVLLGSGVQTMRKCQKGGQNLARVCNNAPSPIFGHTKFSGKFWRGWKCCPTKL